MFHKVVKIIMSTIITMSGMSGYAGLKQLVIPIVDAEQCPVVDGRFMENEWCRAVSVGGMIELDSGVYAERQSKIYYISDGEYIYVGMISPNVPEGTAPENAGSNDLNELIRSADRIEAKFEVPGKRAYYLIADSAGHIYDEVIILGSESRRFNGPWEFRSSYDKNNWYVELRIKASAFGIENIRHGDVWNINFSRCWKFPSQYTGLLPQPHSMAPATFILDAPAVQISELGDLRGGKKAISMSARGYEGRINVPKESAYDNAVNVNPLRVPGHIPGAHVKVISEIQTKSGKIIHSQTQDIPVIAGVISKQDIRRDFELKESARIHLRITHKNLVIYEAELPVEMHDLKQIAAFQERLKHGSVIGSWRLKPAFFPYWEKCRINTSFSAGELSRQARYIKYTISSDKGFSHVTTVPVVKGMIESLEVKIPGLPQGTYTVKGEVLDDAKKVLSSRSEEYQRIVFPWEHNHLGRSGNVIPPWTPVKRQGNSLEVWGRTYELSSLGLPEQIISKTKQLLASPVIFKAYTANGRTVSSSPAGELHIGEQSGGEVSWSGQGTLGELIKLEVKGTLEYDGYTWYDVKLIPRQKTELSKLTLEIPVLEACAQLMHCQGKGARMNFSGAIPSGKGIVYNSLQQSETSYMTGAFLPHIWVGNPDRGLSYFAESDEGWNSVFNKSANEIVRSSGQVSLVMNIINQNTVIESPRTISFGLMASPVKALMPYKNYVTRFVNWLDVDNRTVFQDAMYSPYPKNFDYALATRELDKLRKAWQVDGIRLYFNKHELPFVQREVATFNNEWGGVNPSHPYPVSLNRFPEGMGGYAIERALTDSRIDMLVYYVAGMAKNTPMAGTYWDITGIYPGLSMPENHSAYINKNGKIVPTWNIRHSRQLLKRVSSAWYDIRKEPDYMEIHSTNHICLPFYSFAERFLNFEWLWMNTKSLNPDGSQMDYIDLRPLDVYAAEGIPSQFGIWVEPIIRLCPDRFVNPEDFRFRRQAVRSVDILAALHNHCNNSLRTIGHIDEVEFIGYWDEDGRIKTTPDTVKASIWKRPGCAEIIIANLGKQTVTANIVMNAAAMGISDGVAIVENTDERQLESLAKEYSRNPEHTDKIKKLVSEYTGKRTKVAWKADKGKLHAAIPLDPHDYRIFKITSKQE